MCKIVTIIAYAKLTRFLIIVLMFGGFTATMAAGESLHTIWGELLQRHVEHGVVDYQGFKKDEKRLDEYLAMLDAASPQSLSEQKRLALYINAYNAYTVKLILNNFKDGRPVSSIKKIGGFLSGPWSIEFCRIGGEVYTLDNIEHDIIRPRFYDPRVHFAVNCASQSCPPLIDKPYQAETLDEQLNKNTIAFVNDADFNYLQGSTLYVSKIFTWFSEDFGGDIRGFFQKYAQGALRAELDRLGKEVDIEYLDYDWSLNNK